MKLLMIAALVFSALPAFARDSSHLVCSGYMHAKPDPDNYGFAVLFDESRASDGESRNEVLSVVWGGQLYQGLRLNKNDGFGQNGKIRLKNGAKVFFTGSYQLIDGDTKLHLVGQMNLTPGRTAPLEKISTDLNCTDISN